MISGHSSSHLKQCDRGRYFKNHNLWNNKFHKKNQFKKRWHHTFSMIPSTRMQGGQYVVQFTFFDAICDIYVGYGMCFKFMRCVLKVCDQIWFMRPLRAVHYFKQCLILGSELMGYKFSLKNRQFCRKSVKRSQNASVKCPILKQSGGSNLECVRRFKRV